MVQIRQNPNSGEFIIIWESQQKNETYRASSRIHINSVDDFVKFNVELNDLPIKRDKIGKDVMVDWAFLDGFDTDKKLWIDANSLQMADKKLFYRKEYPYRTNSTISANFYPVTSAIVVRDDKSPKFKGLDRQITIMNDRPQAGSAGLRGRRNIELMQHRRFKEWDHYGVFEPLNDLDEWGRGIQVPAEYYMMINDLNSKNPRARKSSQRSLQRKLEQPLLYFYSHNFSRNQTFNSSSLLQVNSSFAQSPQNQTNQTEGQLPNSSQLNSTNSSTPNFMYKHSKTLKTTIFGIQPN